ncbi:MAG: hypothetical protein ABIG39_07925 [Candidatus Micrarchaeota archaeon]
MRLPTSQTDALQYVRDCGFPGAKSGTFAGITQGSPVIPREGLKALSFVFDNFPELSAKGKDFLSRSLSYFGKKNPDYNAIVHGLNDGQIVAGTILLKVVTEGLSGLNGDLFMNEKFSEALESRKLGSSGSIMRMIIDTQIKVFSAISDCIL